MTRAIQLIGERWVLLILRSAFAGKRRFGDFQRSVGVSSNVLSDRLHRLVEAGVLETRPASDGTSFHEYALTPMGEGLFPVVIALWQWGEQHLFADGEDRFALVDRVRGDSVPTMTPRTLGGEALTLRNFAIVSGTPTAAK